MDFDLDLGQWIVVGLSAFLFIWYLAASTLNRRRGIAMYRWLYKSMEQVGEISHSEWIGSSGAGARLHVEKASRPFRRVEALYLLEPREFLPYWILSHLQGKRDAVIVKITLRSVPKTILDIERAGSRRMKKQPNGDQGHAHTGSWDVEGYRVEFDGPQDARLMEGVRGFLGDYGSVVQKVSLQQEAPHLEISSKLDALMRLPAESYLSPLREWFQERGS